MNAFFAKFCFFFSADTRIVKKNKKNCEGQWIANTVPHWNYRETYFRQQSINTALGGGFKKICLEKEKRKQVKLMDFSLEFIYGVNDKKNFLRETNYALV